jgi:sigma-54 specific flagellar transcriptional regulator A
MQGVSKGTRRPLVVGEGSVMEGVLRVARRIAPSEATVLITGETGTGKEVIARFLHDNSAHVRGLFVPVNCGAIPEALLESELFGHVRGAFTGAIAGRKGRLAMADGGTLFLDEVGELPLTLQVKLLRVLQERVYEPVGGSESVSANFRLVAATNRNLEAEVEAGRFRRDLYYRLMVCPVELPALRERPGDVAALFNHFWRERGETRPIAPGVYALLAAYGWPGNVRELENLVERVSVLAEGPEVRVEDIPPPVRPGAGPRASAPRPAAPPTPSWGPAPVVVSSPPAWADPSMSEAPAALFPPMPEVMAEALAPSAPPPAPIPPAPSAPPPAPPAPVPPAPAPMPPAPMPPAPIPPAPMPPAPMPPAPMPPAPMPPAPMPPAPPSLAGPGVTGPLPAPEAVASAASPPPRPSPPVHLPVDLPTLLRRLEDEYIDAALAKAQGNKKAAADLLGLQRTTLVEKLRRRSREQPEGTAQAATDS